MGRPLLEGFLELPFIQGWFLFRLICRENLLIQEQVLTSFVLGTSRDHIIQPVEHVTELEVGAQVV